MAENRVRIYALCVVLIACGLMAQEAPAADYYVAMNGDNGNPGSLALPWATLQYAVDTIASGDTILVRPGTYAGCRIGKSGQAGLPITLRAETPGTVLVNAAGPQNRHQSTIEIENFSATIRYWVIDGFEVASAARYGIDIRDTEYITIQNCYVHDSAVTGIFTAFSYYPIIQNNESASNGEHGIYQSNSGDHPTIRGNRLHHNWGCGLHMNGDLSMSPPGDGIISFALIEKNVIWENGTGGGGGINMDGGSDGIIRNNLLYNNHASGITAYAIDAAEGSSRNLIYNNTVVMAAGSRNVLLIAASPPGVPDPSRNKVKNNIFYTPSANRASIAGYSASMPGFESDYNIAVDRFSTDEGGTLMNLAQWQSLGHDTHSILATPGQLFMDPANNDYRLKSGSPALNAGVTLPEVTDDIEGTARPSGSAYDIGCYEAPGTLRAGPVPVLRIVSKTTMIWDPATNATVYDVIRGDLGLLHTNRSLGDATCIADDWPSTTIDEPTMPAAGSGFYYFVRGDGPGVDAGIYDTSDAGRDAEVGTQGGSNCTDMP